MPRSLVRHRTSLKARITLAQALLPFRRRRRDGGADDCDPAIGASDEPITVDLGAAGPELDLPRWRRPSLLAARRADPARGAPEPPRTHLAFRDPAAAGIERRVVRYRIVRLLDRPDEVAGRTVGSLDEGDEVAVVEQSGLYRCVQTPDGRLGWLHKMTLGDLVAAPVGADEPIDADALLAYLAALDRS